VFWRGRNWEAVTAKIHWDGSKKRPSRSLNQLCPKQKITAAEKQKEIEALAANPKELGIANPESESASDEPPCTENGCANQWLIPAGERSGLQTHIATTERFVVHAEEKLTAFLDPAYSVGSPRRQTEKPTTNREIWRKFKTLM
jgi:hypothetical protein